MKKLGGKRVLITGGASGIGLETAVTFGMEGCEVLITDINEDGLREAAARIGETGAVVRTYVNDVTDRVAVEKLAEKVGAVDILVNNAGIGFASEIKDTSIADWERLMGINMWGVIHFIRAFLPPMIEKKSGSIVNISSGQAFFPVPTWGAYAATKFFVAGMSEALHYEVARYGIKVTTVFPYLVSSPFYEEIEADSLFGRIVTKNIVPLLGVTPEKTARIIVKAVRKGKKNELHHIGQKLGYYFMRLAPHAVEGAGVGVAWAMSRKGNRE